MRNARECAEWMRTASQMAQLANIHRDPKKGRPRRPSDFYKFPRRYLGKKRGIDWDGMRRAFCPPPAQKPELASETKPKE